MVYFFGYAAGTEAVCTYITEMLPVRCDLIKTVISVATPFHHSNFVPSIRALGCVYCITFFTAYAGGGYSQRSDCELLDAEDKINKY
jgi:hypothetical protein